MNYYVEVFFYKKKGAIFVYLEAIFLSFALRHMNNFIIIEGYHFINVEKKYINRTRTHFLFYFFT